MNAMWKRVAEDLRPYLAENKITGTDFARSIKVSATTILRPLNDPDYTHDPSFRVLGMIYTRMGMEIPGDLLAMAARKPTARDRGGREEIVLDDDEDAKIIIVLHVGRRSK